MIKLIHTGGKHNKFWSAEVDSDYNVTCKWGRMGTTGQSKTFKHYSEWAAQSFIDKKAAAKKKKGYREVEDKTYDLHAFRSKLVGAGGKIDKICWVKPDPNSNWLTEIHDMSEIANPEYNPTIYIDYILTGNRGWYQLLITTDSVCYIGNKTFECQLEDFKEITDQSPKILRDLKDKADGLVQSLL